MIKDLLCAAALIFGSWAAMYLICRALLIVNN